MVDAFTMAPTAAPPARAFVDPPGVMRLGSVGDDVKALQTKLNARGEQLPANGRFGPRTMEAVRRFQLAHGIQPANGIVNLGTQRALEAPEQKSAWGPTIRDLGTSPIGQQKRDVDWFANATAQKGTPMPQQADIVDDDEGS